MFLPTSSSSPSSYANKESSSFNFDTGYTVPWVEFRSWRTSLGGGGCLATLVVIHGTKWKRNSSRGGQGVDKTGIIWKPHKITNTPEEQRSSSITGAKYFPYKFILISNHSNFKQIFSLLNNKLPWTLYTQPSHTAWQPLIINNQHHQTRMRRRPGRLALQLPPPATTENNIMLMEQGRIQAGGQACVPLWSTGPPPHAGGCCLSSQ